MAGNDSAVLDEPRQSTGRFVALGDPTQIDFDEISKRPASVRPSTRNAEPVTAPGETATVGVSSPVHLPEGPILSPKSQFEVAQAASLGVPFQNVVPSQAVSPEEDLLSRRDNDEQYPAEELDDLDLQPSLFSISSLIRQPNVVTLLVAASSLVLLFAATEVIGLLSEIRSLPYLIQPFAYALVLVLSGAVVATCGRVVWLYGRLKASPRVSIASLDTLRGRAVVRRAALDGLSNAEQSLEEFLERFPLAAGSEQSRLRKRGFTTAEIDTLIEARAALLSGPRGSAVGWMDQLNRQFIHQLDEVARRRIRLYTKLVGFKTAAVPNGALDTLIVLINAYLLVGDLCVIYNVRAGGWGTASIMVHILVNALAAGRLDEWSGAASDHAAAAITHHGTGLMANAVKGVSKVAARAADGYINALLIGRLGNATVYHLRPLLEKPATAA